MAFGLAKDVPLYRQLAVQGLSLLLDANMDVGLKHCLSMAYHEDPHVRTVFIHVFSQVLGEEPHEDAPEKADEADPADEDGTEIDGKSKSGSENANDRKDEGDDKDQEEEKRKRFKIADRRSEGQIQPSRLCEVCVQFRFQLRLELIWPLVGDGARS